MNVLDTSIANVSHPGDRGRPGRVARRRAPGSSPPSRVANAISVPLTGWLTQRFGQVRLFIASIAALRDRLAGCAASRRPSRMLIVVPRAAGRRRRADDPAVADAAAVELSAAKARHRAGDVVDDDAGRAGGRAAARRLDHRQHLLAVDLLHQHPGRHRRRGRHLGDLSQARDARRASCRSTPSAWALLVLWVGALQVMLDKGKDLDWFNSTQIVALAVIAARGLRAASSSGSSPRSIRSSTCACSSGATSRSATLALLARLRPVLRQRRAAAAVAAAVHGLHRHARRPGAGAGRRARDPALAAGGQERPTASIRACSRRPRFVVFALVLFMRSHFNTQADHRHDPDPDHHPGRGDGVLLHPADDDHAVGAAAASASRRRGPVQLRAHHGRRVRHLDLDHAVGPPRHAAPRAARRPAHERRSGARPGARRTCRRAAWRRTKALRSSIT